MPIAAALYIISAKLHNTLGPGGYYEGCHYLNLILAVGTIILLSSFYRAMLLQAKNIVRHCIVGVLLLSLSGITIVVHHDHPIETSSPKQTQEPDGKQASENQHSKPSTYHEVHFLKLGSDDEFTISPPAERAASLTVCSVIPDAAFDSFPALRSAAVLHTAEKEAHPSSGDKCALFCSFLI
ncbi:MAG TPA: hypothetical protein VNN76_10975 [Bacteroidota bacterium]|nr:hypothetical protein [Bacteroidota bacterium]